jgi:hypothetical protein
VKPFEGVLSFVDIPSDQPPLGAKGHCVILTRAAAESALDTLPGCPINRRADWAGHDRNTTIGAITEAWIDCQGKIHVRGSVQEEFMGLIPPRLGMSYEMRGAGVREMGARVWTITKCTFEGAAVLKRHTAAYQSTTFKIKRGLFA